MINFNSKQEDFIRKINKKYNYQYLEKKVQILKINALLIGELILMNIALEI